MKYLTKHFNHEQDKNLLINLWFKYLVNPSLERYAFLYENNDVSIIQTALLFLGKENEILGCASILLYKAVSNSNNLVLGINVDMIVERKHRTLGPAILLLKELVAMAKKYGSNALIAIPNQASLPVFKRIGYKCAGNISRYVKIINIEKKLKSKLKNKVIINFASQVINFFMKWISREILYQIFDLLDNKRCTLCFEERFPEGIRSKKNGEIFSSEKYLKWRYRVGGDKGYKKCFFYYNNILQGGLIYRLNKDEIFIEKICMFSDQNFDRLLFHFIKKMRLDKKISSINVTYFGKEKNKQIFRNFGFLKREEKAIMFIPFSEKAAGILSLEEQWDIYESDLDL
ncbi:MAG: hypothetical protein ABIG64_09395 [Candidatus Omnitrophota bacterium]